MDESEKNIRQVDKNLLDLLWKLTNNKSNSRIDASADILKILQRKQNEANSNEATKDLTYTVERLIKGLASSRDAARLGFALLLTEILKQIDIVDIEDVLELMKKHLFNSKQDKRDVIFAELFAYSAIVRSGKLADHSHLSFVVIQIHDLWQGKGYISNACYEILTDLFSQLSQDKFKECVWPHLQPKLTSGFGTCSANSLWPLLLCMRMFPEVVTEKYLKKHWKTEDLFSADTFEHHKKIIRQTTSCLPMLHPFCLEFVALFKSRKDMKDIWNAVVDENLFEVDHTEKAYVGFEMVKKVLQDNPKKKIMKYVLSSKFCTMFARSFLNTKHPMHPAAGVLAGFLSDFVKQNSDPDVQMIILKVFLQPPGSLLSAQIFQRKEVSSIIQNLLPDAVKDYCELLKSVALSKSNIEEEDSGGLSKRFQAVVQIGALVCHPIIISDIEWRLTIIKFLFLHSFFKINRPIDLLHCEEETGEVPATIRESFSNMFFKTVSSLYHRTAEHSAPLEQFLQHLLSLTEYADQVMSADECITPHFPLDKVQESWQQLKSIVHKLSKQSKKDGKTNESNAFQALFLELGFHLFRDPDHIPEILEELDICCKKALHARKHPEDSTSEGNEPSWVGVVVDILLSLLSRSSSPLRSIVTSVFPLLCPFINEDALKQILAVINPEKAEDEAMLVDESGDESDVDFDSGSSSDESNSNEKGDSKIDEQFRKKVKEALGHAAEISDAESVVLSDSEMFKLDDTLAEAFRSRVQTGHTQLSYKDKAMLHFRVRCLDLIMVFLKSEPPMHLVLQCLQPVLAAYEYGHKSRHQTHLLHKAVSTLQILTRIKKFQHQDNVGKSELKELLETLISKCHKENDLAVAKKLYTVCVFLVLCFRRLEATKSPRKESKKSHYLKNYLSALDVFVKGSSSHVYPQMFVTLMAACPDLAWNFIGPCQEYAFDDNVRMYKKTQCFGLIVEALKYSKSQNSIAAEKWLEIGNNFISKAVEALKNILSSSIKPAHVTELLGVVYNFYCIVKEKAGQSLLEKKEDLLPVLMEMEKVQLKKLTKSGVSLRRKIIIALGGKIESNTKKSKKNEGEILSDPVPNEDEVGHTLAEESDEENSDDLPTATEDISMQDPQLNSESKQKKRKSKSKETSLKKMKMDSLPNGTEESHLNFLTTGTEDSTLEKSYSFTESPHKMSKKKNQKKAEAEDS